MYVDLATTGHVLADVDVEGADEVGRSRRRATDDNVLCLGA